MYVIVYKAYFILFCYLITRISGCYCRHNWSVAAAAAAVAAAAAAAAAVAAMPSKF